MGKAWRLLSGVVMVSASTHLFLPPPSFIVQLLTVVMKYDHIRRTDTLACQQADSAQGSGHLPYFNG